MVIRTLNTLYTLVDRGDGAFLISGNAKYCPNPTPVTLDAMPMVGKRFIYQLANGERVISTPVVAVIDGIHYY